MKGVSVVMAVAMAATVGLLAQARAQEQPQGTGQPAASVEQVQGPEALHGLYRIIGGQKSGEEIPADQLQEVTVRIGANAITTYDKDQNAVYAATYQIDASETPYRITMTSKIPPTATEETVAEGLLAAEGDVVKLIYALPGAQAPTAFLAGPQQMLFVLEKTEEP